MSAKNEKELQQNTLIEKFGNNVEEVHEKVVQQA